MEKKRQSYDDATVFRVARLFIEEGESVRRIADELGLKRESVYPLLIQARKRGFVQLLPPQSTVLAEQITRTFHCSPGHVQVVDVHGLGSGKHVAAAAASLAIRLVKEVGGSGRNPVRMGLGSGRATLDFSWHLSKMLSVDGNVPKIKLLAISSGCLAEAPEYASSSFFNLFPKEVVSSCVGLFAETLVTQREFEELRKRNRTGTVEAFEERSEIDIVVTGMGDVDDEHDLLRTFLAQAGVNINKVRDATGWCGNVQYRPFSKDGPVLQKGHELRAVTLFDLHDLAALANEKNKHVILMARTCGLCAKTKATALLPLLVNKKLRVWSDLIMDVSTARELLQLAQQS